jgi:hypothetical protein
VAQTADGSDRLRRFRVRENKYNTTTRQCYSVQVFIFIYGGIFDIRFLYFESIPVNDFLLALGSQFLTVARRSRLLYRCIDRGRE